LRSEAKCKPCRSIALRLMPLRTSAFSVEFTDEVHGTPQSKDNEPGLW
jgi:hypothetical protein